MSNVDCGPGATVDGWCVQAARERPARRIARRVIGGEEEDAGQAIARARRRLGTTFGLPCSAFHEALAKLIRAAITEACSDTYIRIPPFAVPPCRIGSSMSTVRADLPSLTAISDALRERYRFERELGAGGMATVYLASDLKHDRPVAVKVLRGGDAAVDVERFHREIRVLARLRHPFILPLHDSGEAGGSLFFVMPYIDGLSLRARLVRDGRLPVAEALEITRQIADALQTAHDEGVVHRDVKPENILISRSGHALLADFGIARGD